MACSLFFLNLVRNIAVPYEREHREAASVFFGFLEERLAGIEDIKANGGIGYVINGIYRHMAVIFQKWQQAALMRVLVRLVAGCCMATGMVLMLLSGYNLFRSGVLSPPAEQYPGGYPCSNRGGTLEELMAGSREMQYLWHGGGVGGYYRRLKERKPQMVPSLF